MADVDVPRGREVREADAWAPAWPAESHPPPSPARPQDVHGRRVPAAAVRAFLARLAAVAARRSGRYGNALAEERAYGHFFLFIPVFLGAGVALWYMPAETPSSLGIVMFCLLAAWPALACRHREDGLALVAGAAFFVPAGMLLAAVESARLDTVLLDSAVTTHVTGRVVSWERDDRGRIRYRVDVIATRDPAVKRPPEVVTLLARSPHEPIAIGAGIEGRARLSPPSGPALSGLNDFAFNAYFSGTGAVGFFYGTPGPAASVPIGLEGAVRQRIAEWRNGLTEHIRGRIGGDAGAIAAALVTAEQRAISEETVEALREAGLAHVLAISGLNMVLAAGTFLVGARVLMALVPGFSERFPAKKIAAIGALVMVTLYILVSGGAISAVRSWIMIVVMLIAVLLGRTAISLRNVATSAILILVVTPSAVTGPGFQMSYAATLGLVAGYAAWRERKVRREKPKSRVLLAGGALGRLVGGLALSSIIGGVATLIYSVGYFHRIPAYGLAGNMLAMPVISAIVMPFGLLAVLLMPFGLDAIPFRIMGIGIDWMIAMSHWVSSWEGEIVTGRIAPLAFLLIGLGGGLVCILRTGLRHAGTLMVLAGTVIVLLPEGKPPPEILVSEDGRLVAILRDGRAATNRERPPDFVWSQWRRALRLAGHEGPDIRPADTNIQEVARKRDDGNARGRERRVIDREKARGDLAAAFAASRETNGFICMRKAWCAGTSPSGWRVAAIEDPAYLGTACDGADLVVVPLALRIPACRSGARLFTARHLRKSGALEIRASQDAMSASFAEADILTGVTTLSRPWTRHRAYDWRTGQFETGGEPQ